eukprot:6173574-Pleurochrysis_carterae.AAC.2
MRNEKDSEKSRDATWAFRACIQEVNGNASAAVQLNSPLFSPGQTKSTNWWPVIDARRKAHMSERRRTFKTYGGTGRATNITPQAVQRREGTSEEVA